MSRRIKVELTAIQAKVVFNTLDGAADAGSCPDGCTKQELRAMNEVMTKLLGQRDHWINTRLDRMQ